MKTVHFDIDTQIDFVFPAGALYVPGAEKIVDGIARLNRHAGEKNGIVISTMDAHAENDPEFRAWPPHCVAGTWGQLKPAATLLEKRAVVANSPGKIDLSGLRQVLLEKQTFDCFTNVNLEALLGDLQADRYVVYGVVTEICVKLAASGLLKTGKRVELVTDAVRSLNDAASREMLREFTASGGVLTSTDAVVSD